MKSYNIILLNWKDKYFFGMLEVGLLWIAIILFRRADGVCFGRGKDIIKII